jgi:hypothetical protein
MSSPRAEAKPSLTDAVLQAALDGEGIAAIDRRIAALRRHMQVSKPRFPRLVPIYWAEIDLLLELRLWLTGAFRAG